jgi:glycosyltransferase involved in cell wall biosynthesis
VGRKPTAELEALGRATPNVIVTGTVPDVRPWLHNAKLTIVPLRIGGGTRLKIYEAMAAGAPVVSTAIGAEGLDARHGENILIADTPEAFAAECLRLLNNEAERTAMSDTALKLVSDHYSWEAATRIFERCIFRSPVGN